MPVVALLGPQRLQPTVAAVVDALEIAGPFATVTAGWQEREREDDELSEHLRGRTVSLELYRRAEEVFAADPELTSLYRARQERLRELQDLYRVRLGYALDAARELLGRDGDSPLLERERADAVAAVRRLDEGHLTRLRAEHQAFAAAAAVDHRPEIRRHRSELSELLASSSALAIAGGHVAVLLNRLRLFAVLELAGDKPIVAWSAGAMALGSRVVVFHDSPPQGPGNTEVLETGLDAYPGLLPFPHARARLRLDDPRRVALLARRFAPLRCALLDEGAQLYWNGGFWSSPEAIRWLTPEGSVRAESEPPARGASRG